nr:hypothetical protein GCM10020063_083010 [Dactylosporangium thailandense]
MPRSADRWNTIVWSSEDRTGGPLDEIFDALRERFSDLSIQRSGPGTHPGDDDNVYWLTRAGADSDVQIDTAEDGQPPFVLESDTDSLFRVSDVALVVTTLSQWLQALASPPS